MHHDVLFFLLGLAVLLGVARILGEICRRWGFPAVAGEIVAGVFLGSDPPVASREALLRALASALAIRAGRPDDGAYFTARVLEREQLAGTGVGDGVAFPHAEIDGLHAVLLAFARLEHGIDCDAPDGQPVRLVFMLLIPPREYDLQLQLLSAMARLMTQPAVRRGLLDAADAREVVSQLEQAGPVSGPVSRPR